MGATASTPTGIPSLGGSKEGNFIQCKRLSFETAQLWEQLGCEVGSGVREPSGKDPLGLDTSALLYLLCSFWSGKNSLGGLILGVSTPARETQFSVFGAKGECAP